MSSRYIIRHPARPHTWAMWHDEHKWVWTADPADATSYYTPNEAGMAAMEVEVVHGLDCRGCVVRRTDALQDARSRAIRPLRCREMVIEWTEDQLTAERRYADERLRGVR